MCEKSRGSRTQANTRRWISRSRPELDQPLAAIWDGSSTGVHAATILEEAGFRKADQVIELLSRFRGSSRFRSLGAKGSERLNQLMPLLLEAIGGAANPEQTLERILKLLEGYDIIHHHEGLGAWHSHSGGTPERHGSVEAVLRRSANISAIS